MRVVQLRVLGGAVARVAPDATAFPHRHRKIMVVVGAGYTYASEREQHEAWVDSMVDAIGRDDPAAYVNFMSDATESEVREAYTDRAWSRLAAIKAQYDPDNVFHLNHNIPPAQG